MCGRCHTLLLLSINANLVVVVVDVVSNAAVVDIAVVFGIGFLARSSRFQIAVLINNRLINQSS